MNITELPQPIAFYCAITGGDALHFGYWPTSDSNYSLLEAQNALTQLLIDRLPPAPARILEISCGLGGTAHQLHQLGYEVIAISNERALIQQASHCYQGPTYVPCSFLDDDPILSIAASFDVIILQETIQAFPNLNILFSRAKRLLRPNGRIIMCDQVSYASSTRDCLAVHLADDIETAFSHQGFFVRHHQRLSEQVAQTCSLFADGFRIRRERLLNQFGEHFSRDLNRYCEAWQNQARWYQRRQLGYELWELQRSDYDVRGYISGDEQAILEGFQTAFGVSRSARHWQWKFLHNPFGGPYVSSVWADSQLAAHYTAYPVPAWLNGHSSLTMQVGDTFTLPACRGVGRGNTSLLGRAVRFFHRHYCEGRIPFFYGFITGNHRRLGQLFFNYKPLNPVQEYRLAGQTLQQLQRVPRWANWLKAYRIACVHEVGGWADTVFYNARSHYGYLIERNSNYLRWRYQQHPDISYQFFVVQHWQRPVGWLVARVDGDALILVDALFSRQDVATVRAGLVAALRFYRHCGQSINEVRGWFSSAPVWWPPLLHGLGFTAQPQAQGIDFCVTLFDEQHVNADLLAQHFYYTAGDSDLF